MNKTTLLDDARQLLPDTIDLRRRIHANPELGLELPETRRAVLDSISDLDLEITLHERTSGVVAVLQGGRPGRTVLLRGDMDALPMPEDTGLPFASKTANTMHACGHDSHVAMLAGAARLLAGRRDAIAGKIVFMFQPGEEGHAGAHFMIREGVLEGVDAAFAIHIDPRLGAGRVATRSGALLASADVLEIKLKGRGGHASMPHDAIDPVTVSCEIVQALQSFITRRVNVFDPVVLTITTIEAGTATNVIPEAARLAGTLRSVSERARERAHAGIERIAKGVAAAHEVEAEVNIVRGYPVTVNDADSTDLALETAREQFGENAAVQMPTPMMGAEDFSFVLQKVPGAMLFLGARPDDIEHPLPCHSNRMQINEDAMAHGIALHAAIAERYLNGA